MTTHVRPQLTSPAPAGAAHRRRTRERAQRPPGRPGLLGDPSRGGVLQRMDDRDAVQWHRVVRPPAGDVDSPRRHALPPGTRRRPVADLGAALLGVDRVQRHRTE